MWNNDKNGKKYAKCLGLSMTQYAVMFLVVNSQGVILRQYSPEELVRGSSHFKGVAAAKQIFA